MRLSHAFDQNRTYALTETHKRVFSPEALALRSQGQES
jgi:hypothetical protein